MTSRTPVLPSTRQRWIRSGSPLAVTHVFGSYDSAPAPFVPLCGQPRALSTSDVDGPTPKHPRCERCVWALAFPQPFYVYTLHGAGDVPIYIGCTSNLFSRMQQHQGNPYWPDVERTTILGFDSVWDASDAEFAAIREQQPALNTLTAAPYAGTVGGYYEALLIREFGPRPSP